MKKFLKFFDFKRQISKYLNIQIFPKRIAYFKILLARKCIFKRITEQVGLEKLFHFFSKVYMRNFDRFCFWYFVLWSFVLWYFVLGSSIYMLHQHRRLAWLDMEASEVEKNNWNFHINFQQFTKESF